MSAICGANPCPLLLSSSCVFYEGEDLLYIGVQTNDNLQLVIQKINQAFINSGIGYIFNNGLVQTSLSAPVQLGGSLIQNTTIGGNFTLEFTGNLKAAKHITTGGTASQFVKGDGTLDSSSFQPPGNYITALSGDGVATGPGAVPFTLNTVNSNPGTFGAGSLIPVVTVNAKGLVTSLTTTPLVTAPQSITFIGDVFGTGFTQSTITLILQNVNPNPYVGITPLKFAVNAKGLVTAASPITSADIISILGYTPGTVSSVGISVPPAFAVSSSPITTSGIIGISAIGTASQYIKGDGSLGTAPISTSGTAGTSGTSGSSGTTGTSGSSGTSGTTGTSGTAGTSGTSGTTGSSGTSGTSGSTGTSGSSGTTGTSGSSGTTGTSGSSGTSGTTGTSGSSGSSGTTGTSGSSGLSGDRFATTSSSTYTLQAPGNSGTITVGLGLSYTVGQSIIIAYDANNHNEAEVVSYDPLTGVLNFIVFRLTGSGTYSTWQVNLDGATGGDGSSGSSGTSGTSSTSGTSGTTGSSGSSGTSGTTGTSGSSGTSGTSATDGTGGTSGTSGTSSTSGSSGTSGTTGTSGSSGTSGTSATNGTGGTSGTSGSSGTSGTTGTSGTSATSGTSGTTGSSGTSGTSGSTGTSGSSGTSGANGSNGTSGTSGTTPVNQITGSGTTNYLPKFTGASTIGNSQVFDNGTNVGIGTASPGSILEIVKPINTSDIIPVTGVGDSTLFSSFLQGSTQKYGLITGVTYTTGILWIQSKYRDTTGTLPMSLQPLGGNLLLGTTSDNGARLQVSGSATIGGNLTISSGNNLNMVTGDIYFQSNGGYGILSANASRLLVIQNSAFGVNGKLTITADAANEQFLISRASNTNAQLILGYHSDGYGRIQAVEQNVAFRPLVLNQSGGNVLIGTTSDNGAKLQVNGSVTAARLISSTSSSYTNDFLNLNIGTVGQFIGLRFGYDGSSYNKGAIYFVSRDSAGRGNMQFALDPSASSSNVSTSNAIMTLNYEGNVGIGTTSPATRLMVQDSANTYVAHFSGLNQANGIAIGTNSSNVAVIQGYTRTFSATNNIAMQVDGGNVGIGTSSPAHKLSVKGASNYDGVISVDNSTTTGGGAFLIRQNSVTSGFIGVVGSALGNSDRNLAYYGESGIGHRFFVNDGTTSLLLTSSGNVLIGNTSAYTSRLTVQAAAGNRPAIKAGFGVVAGNGYWVLGDNYTLDESLTSYGIDYSSGDLVLGSIVAPSTTTSGAFISTQAQFGNLGSAIRVGNSGDIYFFRGTSTSVVSIGGAKSMTESMRINSSGNVLIGTTTSTGAKLEVNGDIRTGTLDTGYVSGFWKLGRAVIGTQPSETHQIIVEINGALFVIGAAAL